MKEIGLKKAPQSGLCDALDLGRDWRKHGGVRMASLFIPHNCRCAHLSLRNWSRLAGRQIDFAFHNVVQVSALRGQHRPDFQLSSGEMLATHHALYLLLRGNADHLQEFPHRHVKPIFVHETPQ